jgi:hypothetical protein
MENRRLTITEVTLIFKHFHYELCLSFWVEAFLALLMHLLCSQELILLLIRLIFWLLIRLICSLLFTNIILLFLVLVVINFLFLLIKWLDFDFLLDLNFLKNNLISLLIISLLTNIFFIFVAFY